MRHLYLILGPNLNMLGTREEGHYGNLTLAEIQKKTESKCKDLNLKLTWLQSNKESEIVDIVHKATKDKADAIVINPGAFTHTSIAIADALKTFKNPIAEVHLSHVVSRESFRRPRLTSQSASIIIEGLGPLVFYIGIISVLERIKDGISNN